MSKKTKKRRAGRPPFGETNMRRVNVVLGDRDLQRARWIGEGNISLGLRRALETCPDWARKVE